MTSHNLRSRCDRRFVGITWLNLCSQGANICHVIPITSNQLVLKYVCMFINLPKSIFKRCHSTVAVTPPTYVDVVLTVGRTLIRVCGDQLTESLACHPFDLFIIHTILNKSVHRCPALLSLCHSSHRTSHFSLCTHTQTTPTTRTPVYIVHNLDVSSSAHEHPAANPIR